MSSSITGRFNKYLAGTLFMLLLCGSGLEAGADTWCVMQKGESLQTIADRYGVTLSTLIDANDIKDARLVMPGQKIIIPDKTGAVTQGKDASASSLLPLAQPASGIRSYAPSQALVIPVGKSKVLLARGLYRVAIADPKVIDVVVLSENEIIVNARESGETVIHLWDKSGRSTYLVNVVADIGDLMVNFSSLEAFRGISLMVIRNALLLTGSAESKETAEAAVTLAKTSGLTIVNLLKIAGKPVMDVAEQISRISGGRAHGEIIEDKLRLTGNMTIAEHEALLKMAAAFGKIIVDDIKLEALPQVRVELKVVELNKTALRKLGLEWNEAVEFGELAIDGPFKRLDMLDAKLNAIIRETPYARVLSSPNLTTLSGKKASFLVGGELPVPITTVTDGTASTSIEWKNFGIELEVEPYISPDGSIDMQIMSDVSNIDWTNAVTVEGSKIPAFSKRTAKTSVRLLDQETLAIGGLIRQDDTRSVTKVPLLGDIPVIGNLFRSTEFAKGETELVLFIRPVLVTDAIKATDEKASREAVKDNK